SIRPGMERLGAFLNTRLGRERQQVLQNKLALAGRPGNLTVNGFISINLVAGVGLGVFMGVFLLGIFAGYKLPIVGGLGIINTIFLGVIFFLIGYYLPDLWLRQKVQARQKEIRLALPNALDLLTIAVEAGLGFDAALARVTEKYHNALSQEFTQVLNEIRLGRPRLEALDEMGRRTGVEEVQHFTQRLDQV